MSIKKKPLESGLKIPRAYLCEGRGNVFNFIRARPNFRYYFMQHMLQETKIVQEMEEDSALLL